MIMGQTPATCPVTATTPTSNRAPPQPDETVVGLVLGSGRRDLDRDRHAGPVYEPLGAVGRPAGRPSDRSPRHDGSALSPMF
jgi:hypothetical protein